MSQQINLYSPIFRKQRKIFSALTMLQGVGFILVVVAVFYYTITLQTSILEIRAAESGRQLKSELERLKVYGVREAPEERAKALAGRKQALETRLAVHAQALAAFEAGALGRAEGYSEVLRTLARLSMEGVWLTRIEFSESRGELSIAGRATRPELVAAYLERLRAEETLRGQEFAKLEITRSTAQYVEFVLSADDAGAKK